MSSLSRLVARFARRSTAIALVAVGELALILTSTPVHRNVSRGCTTTPVTPIITTSVVNTRAIGGVSIDAQGVVDNATVVDRSTLLKARQTALQEVPADLKKAVGMRKVSLARLEAAAREALKSGAPLPDEVRYLAGLQRIQYVFVYPESHDVVLAGPGEGWRVNEEGTVVGVTTGKPVLLFDDLLVALRTGSTSNMGGMTCSIDPTAEGMQRAHDFMRSQQTNGPPQPQLLAEYEEQLGPQMVTLTGVPESSHFARVMVAADYRMKRLAMKLDESPIRGLPSYLDMMSSGSGPVAALPRWWLAMAYEPLAKDADGLAWELRGQGVKAMAEEDFFSASGNRQKTVKASALVQKWADNMTAKYEELSGKESIFAELRNCMDLAVVSALIARENLTGKAGCAIDLLMDSKALPNEGYFAPKQVVAKASFVRRGRGYLIIGSGGVQMTPWQVAEKRVESEKLTSVRATAAPTSNKWWWN